ncbi:endolytic transglycosylase MltG [Propionibacterium freudenreichii]|uniref:endolytic transglycosylase MltG n=1 Tax=Propionibacterium freudenreichii TaxID=1744 RepID=UPI002485C72B|nr:endolytic transglycosylase MltG [Propionibacterium freudenreichii]WGU91336.1 endolytic transglycosylase MltG [Propionibacterium freudenreichii]
MAGPKRAADEDAEDLYPPASRGEEPEPIRSGAATEGPHGPAASGGEQPPLITMTRDYHRTPGSWLKSVIAVLVSLAVIGGGGFLIYHKVTEYQGADYTGAGQSDVTVTVKSGESVSQMGDLLVAEDVVASRNAFMRAAKKEKRTNNIQAGTYKMKTRMPAADVVAVLVDPSNIVNNRFTVPEGLRNTHVLEQVSSATGIALGQLTAASKDPSLPVPSYAQGSSEGFLFPDTYTFEPDFTASQVLTRMVDRFNQVAADENLEKRAAAAGRSPHDVLVVASIIERETSDHKYAPLVAEVIYNRLAQGMRLQSDATVAYANNLEGKVTTTDEERGLNSPYNTYMVDGLPPTPISNPGKAAIDAVLAPASGDYLYFVTVNLDTGETKFASDSAGHDQNVKEFQTWCQANSDHCK